MAREESSRESGASAGKVELTRIEVPSDNITLGAIWRREPGLFSYEAIAQGAAGAAGAISILAWETLLAENAFAAACGAKHPHPDVSEAGLIQLLNDSYKAYGISHGMNETRAMVRRFLGAVEKQARSIGRSR